jgi:hypothetical protein
MKRGRPSTPEQGIGAERPRVLFVAGAAYARRFLTDLARYLWEYAQIRPTLLIDPPSGAPGGDADDSVFSREAHFPPIRPAIASSGSARKTAAATLMALKLGLSRTRTPEAAQGRVHRTFRQVARRWFQVARYRQELRDEIIGHEIIHYQTLSTTHLPLVRALPRRAKLIVSAWGSDLLRTAGILSYADQSELCERADVITVASLEMREILLAKFGRHLAHKVRLALLGVGLLDEIDRNRGCREEFLASLGIPSGAVTISVGNNAAFLNRHVEILSQLAHLPEDLRRRCLVLLPLSYPTPDPDYVRQIEAACESAGIRGVPLREWVPPKEVARLRCATDVMIHLPVSDAFSAAMQESLYAGSILITGSWLPYSRLRSAGIHYHEVGDIAEVPEALSSVLSNLSSEREAALGNAERLSPLAHPRFTVRDWLNIYEEVLGTDPGGEES